jgi:predicted aconitase
MAQRRKARARYLRSMTAEQNNAARRIAAAIAKGVKDGIPVLSNVRAALRDPDVPKVPRLLASLATVAALVLAVYKFATGAITLPELVQLIQAALTPH